jgi:hypothetical protein
MSAHIRGADVLMTRKELDAVPIPPSGNLGERCVNIVMRGDDVPLPMPFMRY